MSFNPPRVNPLNPNGRHDGQSAHAAQREAERAPQPHAGLPMGFVRSSLFGVSGSRELVRNERLEVGPRVETLTYSGPKLSQNHAMIWQALMSLAIQTRPAPGLMSIWKSAGATFWTCSASPKKTAKPAAGSGNCSKISRARSSKWRPRRIAIAMCSSAPLALEKATGKLTIRIPARAVALLCDEMVLIDLPRKRRLGKAPLTLWLHDFISSQSNDPLRAIPWPVEGLRTLSGSALPLFRFRAALRKSAQALADDTDPLLKSWHIDAHDRLVYAKTPTRTVLLPAQAAVVRQAQSAHIDAVQAAREQRMRVLL